MIEDILKACEYPTSTIVLDAETYFDDEYTLKKLSLYKYVTSPKFQLLGWAVKQDQEGAVFTQLPPIDWTKHTIIMHNAPFDALILALHYDIHPPYIIDTLDLARHIEPRWKNSLKDLCIRHNLPAKGDTLQFKGLHKDDYTIGLGDNLVAYATNDAEREYDLFKLLLPKLSNPKFELEIAEYTRNLFLQPVLHFNSTQAKPLKLKMKLQMKQACRQADVSEKVARSKKRFGSLLRGYLGDEEPPMKQGKRGSILAIARADPGYEYLLGHPNEQVRHLMEARVAAKSWPLHIARIERLGQASKAAGGKLPIPLRYYGAHSGRWSGSEGVNVQNLPAHGHPLVNKIRELIEAPPGYTLIIGDFSQIEARVLAWLAQQNDLVKKFVEGKQIYCEFASQLTGYNIRKPKPTDSSTAAKWYNHYRALGKIGVLGAGYGMGEVRCRDYARNTFGVNLDASTARRLIQLYRRTNGRIVQFWNDVERMFLLATQHPSERYQLRNLRFFRDGPTTVIQLPSTRRLYYYGAKVEGRTDTPQLVMPNPASPEKKLHMWGGYLCLAGHTQVLTKRGWIRLDNIHLSDYVWDGLEWVQHYGLVYQGYRHVISVSGIMMTPDHQILTTGGWHESVDGATNKLNWATVRLPNGTSSKSFGRSKMVVVSSLPMWERTDNTHKRANSKKWGTRMSFLSGQGKTYDSWYDTPSGILGMAFNAGSLSAIIASSVEKLRGARNYCLQTVERIIRKFLGRHGADVSIGTDSRPNQQQWKLRAGKLPMGHTQTAGQQQEVYDILGCGPRHRFTVRDGDGVPRLVHNCENIVQAVSRDILAEAVLRIKKELGVRIPLIVHDDMSIVVPEDQAEIYKQQIIDIAKHPLEWADGLPIDIECRISKRYNK